MADDRVRVPSRVVRAAAGEQITVAGAGHLFKLTGAETGQALALEQFDLAEGQMGARPHVHWSHDEHFYLLDGQLTFATDEGELVLSPGDLAHAPRGSVHGFRNASTDTVARALCFYTPAGYEQFFRDVHAAVEAGTEFTDDLMAQLRARYDSESS